MTETYFSGTIDDFNKEQAEKGIYVLCTDEENGVAVEEVDIGTFVHMRSLVDTPFSNVIVVDAIGRERLLRYITLQNLIKRE